MEPFFTNYLEYKEYVYRQWQDGFLNELEQDGFIVEVEETFEYECASREIKYRLLTEKELESKWLN